ncbi:Gfo/Idh/MocA family oxidoreductase, partial [Streptomyces sp. NPDC059627]
GVRTAGHHSTAILTDWAGRFKDAFDTEFREWITGVAAGTEPTGPSAWDGYAATVITNATVEARRSGRIVATDMKPRPAFYGGDA